MCWIQLGIITAIRKDEDFSFAEMVNKISLRLPGKYLSKSEDPLYHINYVTQLQNFVRSLKLVSVRKMTSLTTQVNKRHFNCSHVLARHGGVESAPQRPYNGPF